ncbi:uncharacterized protein LOC134674982 [Cydia fagiglandana]|uniref:uncharacterized protein LOC134674982 n=1 Tax=Cydia fagiglandana TaxID=1458189 RepID=UPI002FEE58AC
MAVRPPLLYGSECWPIKETNVQKLHTAEMKMLSFKVAPILEKLTEYRLRWYGHVMRRGEEYVAKKALNLPEKERGQGRPPTTWWTSMTQLLKKNGLPEPTTLDRISWRKVIRRADPT